MPELPTQSEFVRAVREREIKKIDRLCRWGYVGSVVFLLTGTFCANFFQFDEHCVIWIIVPIISATFWVLVRPVTSAHFHCSSCGATRLVNDSSVLFQCPQCGKQVFCEEKFAHLKLPQINRWKMLFCLIAIFVMWSIVALQVLSHTPAEKLGGSVLEIYGLICLMWGMPFLLLISVDINELWKKNRSQYPKCPICGETHLAEVMKYTGRCSVCASVIDPEWPPDESDSHILLPTLAELQPQRQYCAKMILPALLYVFVGFTVLQACIFIFQFSCYMVLAISVLLLIPLIIVSVKAEQKKREIPNHVLSRCPFCTKRINGHPRFLRCPHCRRKLVRDDDAGKEGDHA